jgi:hypothetical protein
MYLAAQMVVNSNALNLSARIEAMSAAMDEYDNLIMQNLKK